MNRSLRSTLNKHVKRAFASLAIMLLAICSYAQITDCPSGLVSLIVDDTDNCTAAFMASPAITAGAGATFTVTGATDVAAATDFTMLSGFAFAYGVSEVTIIDGAESCIFGVVVTDAAPSFTAVCIDITVDLAGECTQVFSLPADYPLPSTANCTAGNITFAFSDVDPSMNSVTLDATMLGDMGVTVFVSNGMEQTSCAKTITVIDSAPITAAITCPSTATLAVAPTCQYVYAYSVDATLPCGGMLAQTSGDPSNTILTAGTYMYAYEVTDNLGAVQASCAWTITIDETGEAGAQVNCLAELNVSIDQTCQAILDPTNFVTGMICGDISLYTVAATLPSGEELTGSSITFNQDQVGTEIEVTVFDPNGVNSCWSIVTVEDKIAPIIMCPDDLVITCLESTDTSMTGVPVLLSGVGGMPIAGTCGVELFFDDVIQDFACEGPFQRVLSRTFYVIDNAGNRSESCTQTISITRETLASTTYPEHFDGLDVHSGITDNGVASNPPLACDGQDIFWNSYTNEQGRIVPSPFDSITVAGDTIPGTGAPGGVGTCGTIKFFFEDLVVDICDEGCTNFNPSYKVLRTFDIYDWCTGETRLHEQIIKVIDSVPPVFTIGVPDLTISTDLWGCGATINLPVVEATDNCASDVSYSWFILNGTYDAVLNRVYIPANALTEIGEEIELIAFAEDCCGNVVADTGYVTIIDAIPPTIVADEHTVVSLNSLEDNGGGKVLVETFDDGSWDNCGPIDMWIRRMDNACENYDGFDADGNLDSTEVDEVNDFQKQIHFCCRDVDEEQRVIFMVCDDGDRDGIVEMNGDDNCSTAMIIVEVQDKLAPTVVCPNPVTINCIEFAAYEDFIGQALDSVQEETLTARFGEAFTTSTCVLVTDQSFDGDELCGTGTATRTFNASNSNGTASCEQTIFIAVDADNVLTCDRITFPTLSLAPNNYDWCDPSDIVAPFVSPVIVESCGEIVIEEPVIDRDDLCTEVGMEVTLDTFNFAGGGCVKILAHWEVIDQCIFDENYLDDKGDLDPSNDEIDPFQEENGYFEIYIEYDIFDNDPPIVACDSLLVETLDCEFNYDSFSITGSDECTPAEALGYAHKVDFGADGTYDYPADTTAASGSSFDATVVGGLPVGTHSIKWIVSDGCGNFSTCIQTIEVVRRIKAPTPYCHLGLSSAVMDEQFGCAVEMWATDFIPEQGLGACGEALTYLMIPYQDIYKDPALEDDDLTVEEALALAEANWEFGCAYIENGVQHVIEIRIYAVDENGVYDFCDASLTLNDNFDCCEDVLGAATSISGNVMTESGIVIEDIQLRVDGEGAELPKSSYSNETGSFVFNNLPYDEDYRISAYDNEDALEGVSTLDLVLIQRHILGMTELNSPYKLIAADINNNQTISATDLLQLRKMILGLYPDDLFPKNLSWRFLDNSYKFVDPTRPFPYNEVIHISNLPHAMYNQNFVAVKTGDVNNSIQGSLKNDAAKRENRNYLMSIDNAIFEKGEFVTVPIKAGSDNNIVGLQFAMEYDESVISSVEIVGESLTLASNNVSIEDNKLRLSWNQLEAVEINEGDVLFLLKFRSNQSSRVTNAIRLDAKTLSAEVYNENLETENLSLNFRTLEGQGLELMQNEPNPFSDITRVSFNLPVSGNVSFKIYDITGKMLVAKNEAFSKGYNTIPVDADELGVDGVLYYQIEFNGEQLTKKMILID